MLAYKERICIDDRGRRPFVENSFIGVCPAGCERTFGGIFVWEERGNTKRQMSEVTFFLNCASAQEEKSIFSQLLTAINTWLRTKIYI